MRMSKEFRPELVFSTGPRYAMSCPFLDISTVEGVRVGRIVSTCGRRLLVLPVELDDSDTMGSIPISAFVLARKTAFKHMPDIIIYCTEGVCSMTDGGTVPRPDIGRFPSWRAIVTPNPIEREISFDPSLLLSMAKAMGTLDRITLRIPVNPGKPIHLVGGASHHQAENSILMPMS